MVRTLWNLPFFNLIIKHDPAGPKHCKPDFFQIHQQEPSCWEGGTYFNQRELDCFVGVRLCTFRFFSGLQFPNLLFILFGQVVVGLLNLDFFPAISGRRLSYPVLFTETNTSLVLPEYWFHINTDFLGSL